jgi:tRNA(Ile)-lysidine synthase TilS/MesJ
MECNHCRREAILFQPYSGQHLCDRHLSLDVERKAKRIIRQKGWITPGDRIAVAIKGDARGRALLHFLVSTFGARRDLSFLVVTIEEPGGDSGDDLGALVRAYGLHWIRKSRKGESPMEGTPYMVTGEEGRGFFRGSSGQHLLQIAQENHATRIALASTVEDEAYAMMVDLLKGDVSHLKPPEGPLPCIRPFRMIPEKEITLYAHLHTGMPDCAEDPPRPVDRMREGLESFTSRHPSTPFALAHLRQALTRSMQDPMKPEDPAGDIIPRTEVPGQEEDPHAV